MTAFDRLHAAQLAALQGDYEFALKEYIWFHNHAVAEQPSLGAVRLSFALGHWRELGKVFPPALDALKEIRNNKADSLLKGDGDRATFMDVEAINERLEAMEATYQLYRQLLVTAPDLARACAIDALPSIVVAKDYRLARQVGPDPEEVIVRAAELLTRDVQELKERPYTEAPLRWVAIRNFAEKVQLHLEILRGNGELAEVARLKELAVRLIPSPSLRKAVQAEFVKPSRAPIPRRYRVKPARRYRNLPLKVR